MCGICGVYRLRQDEVISSEGLELMKSALVHRGPDQEGSYVEPFLGLGHRRLSIIGVSDGRQPLSNETRSVWVSFNGEIYNHHQLRQELVAKGHRFATGTDSEVLVHLYEEEGVDFLTRLRGMFALAIWDKERERLLLARDRLGQKPLYYQKTADQLLFASEIKGILAYPGQRTSPNLEALHHYLSLGYIPAPLTGFRGIASLPAAHVLELTPSRMQVRPYWELAFEPATLHSGATTLQAVEEELESALDDAVGSHLESEVPLGVFLSGGVDSSAMAERMRRLGTGALMSTTIRFEDPEYDESPHAREVAELLGTDHQEREVGPTSTDVIEKMLWHFDEPFADASALPTYFLCGAARERLTVAISGDGGDEMFAGYNHYAQFMQGEARRRSWPASLRRLFAPAALLYPALWRGRTHLENLNLRSAAAFANTVTHFSQREKSSLYSGDFRSYLDSSYRSNSILERWFETCSTPETLSRAQYVDYKSYLADDILVKVDRMSMAHSLEVRAPLLDHELVERVARYPSDLKLRREEKKFLFRRVLSKRLPAAVLNRPKQGFSVPLANWFSNDLRGYIEDVLFDGRLARRGYFSAAALDRVWACHKSGGRRFLDMGNRLWILLVFELWHRMYVDADAWALHQGGTSRGGGGAR